MMQSPANSNIRISRQFATASRDVLLHELALRWQTLAERWDMQICKHVSGLLNLLLDRVEGEEAETAGDLAAYLAVFADGSLIPNRSQQMQLTDMTAALFQAAGISQEFALGGQPKTTDQSSSNAVTELSPSATPGSNYANNLICLLGLTDQTVPGLSKALVERGFETSAFALAGELVDSLLRTRPSALLVHANMLRSLPRLRTALNPPDADGSTILIVISDSRDLTYRLLAMRAKCAAFFSAPLDSYQIVARIEEVLGHHNAPAHRVLLIDSERALASRYAQWLVEQGITVRLAWSGEAGLVAATEFRPDIVLINANLSDARGFEVAQALNQQPEFATLPSVLFADDDDGTTRLDAIAAGCDEVLIKPIKARHLLSVIQSRVQRAKWLRGQSVVSASFDARTGLQLRAHLINRLTTDKLEAGTFLIVLIADHAELIHQAVGLSALSSLELELAQMLRESVAPGDLVTQIRDLTYALLIQRDHRDLVSEFAEKLRLKFGQRIIGSGDKTRPLTISAGIAELDDSASNADARVALAERAASAASQAGGNRVSWSSQNPAHGLDNRKEAAVHAVLSRPLRDDNVRVEFLPLVPLSGRLVGQFDMVFRLISAVDNSTSADYAFYVPVAQKLGALFSLERTRIECALQARQDSLQQNKQLRIFLPIASHFIIDDEQRNWLLAELDKRELSGSGLTLEIPGSDLIDHQAELKPAFEALRAAGVRMGISDYGKDWAAIHLLSKMPVEFVRLDIELVQSATSAHATNSTLLTLVRKAHQLGAQVIAPHIDHIQRAHVLLRFGVDYGVGEGFCLALNQPDYDFSRPIW